MGLLEEFLIDFARKTTDHTVFSSGSVMLPWLVFAGFSSLYGVIAGYITTYHGQAATGSGVAEVVGYLNGINYPDFISWSTLIVKVIGVTLAVSGKLCVGKEGPLAHIGAIIGVAITYTPNSMIDLRFLRNDEQKRVFAAAGASTGVSVAFGAPIGGALFCYEMSKSQTFWRFEHIWRVFFSCCIGTFTLAILSGIKEGGIIKFSG